MTWATMAVPVLPSVLHGSHAMLGWPAAPHPLLDYVEDGYMAAAFVGGSAACLREAFFGTLPRLLFCASLALSMAAAFAAGPWVFALILVNHWTVAIGLAVAVDSRWDARQFAVSAATLSLAGGAIFAVLFLRPGMVMRLTAWAVGIRIGLGFVHFLYDRAIWRDAGIKAALATSGNLEYWHQ